MNRIDRTEISVNNSTTTALASGATYTGQGELNDAESVMVSLKTDQNGTLYMEFSPDGTNWDSSLSFQYDTTRINPPHILIKGARYYRTRFTNTSDTDQTYFRLQTEFGSHQKLTAPINGTLAENYDALVTRSTDYRYEVAMGKRQGRTTWNQFGYNADIDAAASETIWAAGGTFNVMTTADTLSVVSSSTNDTNGGTGANTIIIVGIDENYLSQTEVVTMNGTTPVTTSNQWLGINRVYVYVSGSLDANDGNITISDSGATFGTQAYISSGESVTQQCIFHTQINHTFLADWLVMNALKVSGGGGSPRITIKGWSYSRFTDTKYEVFRFNIDTSVENTVELKPSQPFTITGREVFYLEASTDTNNTSISCRFSGIEERVL